MKCTAVRGYFRVLGVGGGKLVGGGGVVVGIVLRSFGTKCGAVLVFYVCGMKGQTRPFPYLEGLVRYGENDENLRGKSEVSYTLCPGVPLTRRVIQGKRIGGGWCV